ncbi:MAG: Asp-tRNA(Asn)/Glu-tRNA(Gln) amidotransferase subunit GatC [Planctomycetota bacterium]|jgi:aspartyl-tRNA(Asn)/glutamyl-tRNA(Gln) amidotransferase subunit C|nr:Asp-tRNA(Asn)/Glu-tRNA(Gln) amidotransferase subunit GatC [Planctomycetota bacterium]
MKLTEDQVRWVAHLARLDLSTPEITALTPQLAAIVDYVDQLAQLDTQGIEPLAHALPVHNVFREDEPTPSLTVAEALANAPRKLGDCYAVPAVMD